MSNFHYLEVAGLGCEKQLQASLKLPPVRWD